MAILGKVQALSGLAYAITDTGQRQLQAGDILPVGGKLVTAPGAVVTLLLNNGQTVHIGGDLLLPLAPDLDQAFVDDLNQQTIDRTFIQTIFQAIENNEDIDGLLEETSAGLSNSSQNNYGFNFVDLQIQHTQPEQPASSISLQPTADALPPAASLFSTPFTQQLYGQPLPTASQLPSGPFNAIPVAQFASIQTFEAVSLLSGNMIATDGDGDALLFTLLGIPQPGFTLNNDGSYTFDPQDPAYDQLAQGEVLTNTYLWEVSDGKGGVDSATLDLTITGVNDAPMALADNDSAIEDDAAVTGSIASNDSDVDNGAVLTYALDNVVPGLNLNADGSYVFDANSYDSLAQGVTTGVVGSYTVADEFGATDTSTLSITVTGINDTPILANAMADQMGRESSLFSFTFPLSTFADVDSTDVLAYSATLSSGAALPAWLSFDGGTRTISGTPPLTASGLLDIRITATDPFGASVFEDFNLDIANLILGTSGNNNLIGTAGKDYIDALAGNDTLNGGLGSDTMIGGLGNDLYVVDDTGDVVTENAASGTDTVQSSIDLTLAANVENLTLTGTGNLAGTGNDLNNNITGNTGNNTIDGGLGNDTMAGGAGNDTYIVNVTTDVVTEAAAAGNDTVLASASFTLGTNVENLTLTGNANINATGNTLNNVLTGNDGDNILNGSTGADTMMGGSGNDTYVVDNVGDIVTENAAEGIDLVQSGIAYVLGVELEHLTLTGTGSINGTGNDLDNILTGNSGNNSLSGGLGNDTINAGNGNDTLDGGQGADSLVGGIGNDVYIIDHTGDSVIELAAQGTDRVQAGIDHTLAANVENLTLTGTDNINGTGNEFNNNITGNTGNNTIDGGLGNDTMIGGAGDDTYIVDATTDVVTEAAASGVDTVRASVTLTLGANVENLTLTGAGNINGTGNTLDNLILGNDGNNLINGATGADTMMGGLGNDTYMVDNVGDVVTEYVAAGIDLVQSSITYTLGAEIENLTLTGSTGISATGNNLDNILTGNTGNNLLVADTGNDTLNGGNGNDTMQGGLGDDVYVVNATGDVVTENLNEGNDTVQSAVSLTLAANVETLMLTGTGNINATGNSMDNVLIGNSGNNVFNGAGGADTMQGGLGNDTYVVDDLSDVILENSGEGTDMVQTSISLVLAANAENLTLTGAATIDGTGNDLNNILTGNTANNLLMGSLGNDTLNGGTGNDTMQGGEGDDVYVVNAVGDIVTENANEGLDLIQSSVSIAALAANVENLTLTGGTGLSATGNSLDNILTGNTGNNNLNGAAGNDTINAGSGNDTLNGGLGADSLIGGLGNDLYVIDDIGDSVTELAAQGTDSAEASISQVLALNVENLTLTGTANINGTGNDLNNVITGNSGSNLLSGGLGNDTMTAGAGADTIMGGAGNDSMTGGGAGVDVFRWELADRGPLGIPDIDILTDFAIAPFASGGDVLDIRDLLVDENQLGGVGNLDDYLHFEKSGLNTILHISHDGGFSAGYTSANEDLTINFINADLVGIYLTDNDIIDNLLNSQKLLTDMV